MSEYKISWYFMSVINNKNNNNFIYLENVIRIFKKFYQLYFTITLIVKYNV